MATHEIVCLANSIKYNGSCVAGKEMPMLQWIRPVGPSEHGELSQANIQYANGRSPQILDIIRIQFERDLPSFYQPENKLIAPERWNRIGQYDSKQIDKLCDHPDSLWGNSDKLDRVHVAQLQSNPPRNSLHFIRVDRLSIHKSVEYRAIKIRAIFLYGGVSYNLVVTDPQMKQHYADHSDGLHELDYDNIYLCVSLGVPFKGYCYKLVASMLLWTHAPKSIAPMDHVTKLVVSPVEQVSPDNLYGLLRKGRRISVDVICAVVDEYARSSSEPLDDYIESIALCIPQHDALVLANKIQNPFKKEWVRFRIVMNSISSEELCGQLKILSDTYPEQLVAEIESGRIRLSYANRLILEGLSNLHSSDDLNLVVGPYAEKMLLECGLLDFKQLRNSFSIQLVCCECGSRYLFSQQEQAVFKRKLWDVPKRCQRCRLNIKLNALAGLGWGYEITDPARIAHKLKIPRMTGPIKKRIENYVDSDQYYPHRDAVYKYLLGVMSYWNDEPVSFTRVYFSEAKKDSDEHRLAQLCDEYLNDI